MSEKIDNTALADRAQSMADDYTHGTSESVRAMLRECAAVLRANVAIAQPAVPGAVEHIRSVLADIVCEDDALKAVDSIRAILSATDSEGRSNG